MSTNSKDKTTIILCDLSYDTNKADIESFLSQYKDKINSIDLTEKKPYKAMVYFKDYSTANECRINMNQKKIKSKAIRIMWEEKDFLQKNKDNKNSNLYVKNIPKNKTHREIFEYFFKFGDIFSVKINEDEKGNMNGTAFVTYYNPDDAKKAIDETNGKKIWDSDMDVQYRKSNEKNNDNNLKINISNLPDNYTDDDITKLCEEFGKIHIVNVNKGQNGKYAIVKFNSEQEAKNAKEKLNNKEIGNKKIYTKDVKDHYYHYNYNYNNKHNNYQQNYYYNINPVQMIRPEENNENNQLYIRNIPYIVTEEELRETFEKFGKITSIKLEKETNSNDKNQKVQNKGYGYISFEKVEEAKKALESLNGVHIKGTESWPKPLLIDYYVSKEKRQMQKNYYEMQTNPMAFPQPGVPPQFGGAYPPMMMPMPMPGQYMWNQVNYKNNGYNNYNQRYNNNGYPHRGKRGQRGGGYHQKNYQRRQNKNENSPVQNINQEDKKYFDHESFKKLSSAEERKEFLGEKLYEAIHENLNNSGKGENVDMIAKITGMIMEIPENEIIEILEKPSVLDLRVKEALNLLNKGSQ